MNWLLRHRARHFVVNSIWVFPLLSMIAALIAVRISGAIDERLNWPSILDRDTTASLLSTLAAAIFTLVVFVSSTLLIAVQLSSASLTPRIIGVVFRSPVIKMSLSTFMFTFVFTLAALIRIRTSVPTVTVHIAAYSCVISLVMFLILIDRVGKSLRPSGAMRSVGSLGRAVIDSVYPHPIVKERSGPSPDAAELLAGEPIQAINSPKDGVVVAFDIRGLVLLAQQSNCVIVLVPQVGDHIAVGDPVLHIYGSNASGFGRGLAQRVVVGFERTLEQDPMFALRILVDIASKGLSSAINDPTTAVLAIDQIHHLLHLIGGRDLDTGEVRDAGGRLRLIYRTPNWGDFVRVAVTEIRHFGGLSIQVARRLRAMVDDLIETLPETRRDLLQQELKLLKRSAERFFTDPEDRALAAESDAQGVGGTNMPA